MKKFFFPKVPWGQDIRTQWQKIQLKKCKYKFWLLWYSYYGLVFLVRYVCLLHIYKIPIQIFTTSIKFKKHRIVSLHFFKKLYSVCEGHMFAVCMQWYQLFELLWCSQRCRCRQWLVHRQFLWPLIVCEWTGTKSYLKGMICTMCTCINVTYNIFYTKM